jgi:tetratricopeptide (TPR) repeat protein
MRVTISGIICAAGIILVACQHSGQKPPAMSLEEAKSTATALGDSNFVVPPRRIDDILEGLERSALGGDETAKRQARVAAQPPATADEKTLAKFYFDRATAARELGLTGSEVADYRLAYQHAVKGYGPTANFEEGRYYTVYLASAESKVGNAREAIELMRLGVRNSSQTRGRPSALSNLARRYIAGGDLASAEKVTAEFQEVFDSASNPDEFYRNLKRILDVEWLTANGKYAEAQPLFREIIDLYFRGFKGSGYVLEANPDLAIQFGYQLAWNLLRQGRVLEAEATARDYLWRAVQLGGTGSALVGIGVAQLSEIVAAEGRPSEAVALIDVARSLMDQAGVPELSSYRRRLQLLLVKLYAAQRDWLSSRREIDGLTSKPDRLSQVDNSLQWTPIVPLVLSETGDGERAVSVARARYDELKLRFGDDYILTAQFAASLGICLARQGETEESLQLLRLSVPILSGRARALSNEGQSEDLGLVEHAVAAYVSLLSKRSDQRDAGAEAFRVADLLRARSVQGAINASSARAATRDPAQADLVRREQDIRLQLSALSSPPCQYQ